MPVSCDDIKSYLTKQLKYLIEYSGKEGREYGASICQNVYGGLRLGDFFEGSEIATLILGCREDEEEIGTFHTHIRKRRHISLGDIKNAIMKGDKISCVGTVKDKTVRCFNHPEKEGELAELVKTIKELDNEIFQLSWRRRPRKKQVELLHKFLKEYKYDLAKKFCEFEV